MNSINIGKDLYLKGRIGWKGLSKSEYLEISNYRIINATSLEDSLINWTKCGYISEERYIESPEIQLQEEDILISKDGTLGKIGYVKNLNQPSTVASGVFVLRNTKNKQLDTDYLYHFLKSNIFKEFIGRMKASGSTINHLYQRDLERLEIKLPDLVTQKGASSLLNIIDKKMALLEKENFKINQLINLIYDYWFIQFDFPDKNGKPYSRNDGQLVYVEKLNQKIPLGWKSIEFGKTHENLDSKRVPLSRSARSKRGGIYPYYGATEIFDFIDDYIFDDNLLLVAEDGSVEDEYGMIITQYVSGKCWINNHAHVLKPRNGYSTVLLRQLIKHIPANKVSTGSIQKKITQDNLNKIDVIDIPKELRDKYISETDPMYMKLEKNKIQIDDLLVLRKWLLPMLMNGQAKL